MMTLDSNSCMCECSTSKLYTQATRHPKHTDLCAYVGNCILLTHTNRNTELCGKHTELARKKQLQLLAEWG